MGMKWIKFKDGTQIPLFSADMVNVWDDSITLGEQARENYALSNAFIVAGNPAGGFLNNPNGVILEDYDGNIWQFVRTSERYIALYISKDGVPVQSYSFVRDSSGSCWMYYLVCDDVTDDNYRIRVDNRRPSGPFMARKTTGTPRYIRGGYIDGVSGNYTYGEDAGLVQETGETFEYVNSYLRDCYTGGVFVSIQGAWVGPQTGGGSVTYSAIDYYTYPYSNGASGSTKFTLTAASITDQPPAPTPPTPTDDDPYADIDGESDITGGGTVSVPGFPALTATSTGIIGLFAPSAAEMQQLASYMWTDFGGTGTTTEDILKEVVEALKRSISNPLDYVIGLNIIPSQGLSIGSAQTIRFGFTSSNVSMPRLSNQYFTVDCGTLNFPALCGDTFLDYAPYAKFSIYLPYIGVKEVDANDFVGHTIGVIYHGDVVTGGITAYITKDGSVMYQYSGCCALNVPLSADGWGSTIAGAVEIATSLVSGGIMGGAAGVGAAAANGASRVAANPSLLSPSVAHSGAVSGGAGCMGVQYPFVIREAVRFHTTTGFNKITGYPSFYYRLLGDVSGFTTVVNAHMEYIPATKGELAEIEELLKTGVIL